MCPPQSIISRVHGVVCLSNVDVELDHLGKEVSVRFLPVELPSFPLTLINVLKILCFFGCSIWLVGS